MSIDGERAGVVERIGALLRATSTFEPAGASTTQLAGAASLARATTHRLLASLEAEGLVDRDRESGSWHLGPEIYLLGAAAAARYDISDHARQVVHRLAEATGESAFLSAVRGDETVCLLREDGSFPLRSHVLHEGLRLPLGVASAGLAALALMPDREIDTYLDRVDLTAQWGESHAREPLLERVAATRRDGFATNPGLLVEGSWGVGAAVLDSRGAPVWALSLTGVETRFTSGRRPQLGRILLKAAHELSSAATRPGR